MATSIELRQERAKLLSDARGLVDQAEKENRNLSADESKQYDKMFKDADEIQERIARLEKNEKAEKELAQVRDQDREAIERSVDSTVAEATSGNDVEKRQVEAYRSFLMGGMAELSVEQRNTLQVDSLTKGGFLVTPQVLVASLLKKLDDLLFMRGLATVQQLASAVSLGVPTLDTDPADADWTGELTNVSQGTMEFGKRELTPRYLSKLVRVSNVLLRKSVIPAESLVMDRLAYKFAVTQEKAFLSGNGAAQPLGVFTASNDGIPTSRDMSTDNAGTAVTYDGLKNAKGFLKSQYRRNAQWVMHRDLQTQISKIKDGEGRYIWQDSIVANEPDMLLGFPVNVSEYAPSTFTSGLYVAVLGDFSYYYIAEALSLEVQRLNELYAASNETGFIGRAEVDGMPALAEAFVRVKLG